MEVMEERRRGKQNKKQYLPPKKALRERRLCGIAARAATLRPGKLGSSLVSANK